MTPLKSLDLAPEEFRIVDEIVQRYLQGRPIYFFGSRATGRARRRSDLDIAVGGEPLSLAESADLQEAFSESDLPILVDVVELSNASGIFRERIENEWIPYETVLQQMWTVKAA